MECQEFSILKFDGLNHLKRKHLRTSTTNCHKTCTKKKKHWKITEALPLTAATNHGFSSFFFWKSSRSSGHIDPPLIFHSNQLRTMMFRVQKSSIFIIQKLTTSFNPSTHGCHEKLTPTQTALGCFQGKFSKRNDGCAINFEPPQKKTTWIPYV